MTYQPVQHVLLNASGVDDPKRVLSIAEQMGISDFNKPGGGSLVDIHKCKIEMLKDGSALLYRDKDRFTLSVVEDFDQLADMFGFDYLFRVRKEGDQPYLPVGFVTQMRIAFRDRGLRAFAVRRHIEVTSEQKEQDMAPRHVVHECSLPQSSSIQVAPVEQQRQFAVDYEAKTYETTSTGAIYQLLWHKFGFFILHPQQQQQKQQPEEKERESGCALQHISMIDLWGKGYDPPHLAKYIWCTSPSLIMAAHHLHRVFETALAALALSVKAKESLLIVETALAALDLSVNVNAEEALLIAPSV